MHKSDVMIDGAMAALEEVAGEAVAALTAEKRRARAAVEQAAAKIDAEIEAIHEAVRRAREALAECHASVVAAETAMQRMSRALRETPAVAEQARAAGRAGVVAEAAE